MASEERVLQLECSLEEVIEFLSKTVDSMDDDVPDYVVDKFSSVIKDAETALNDR